MNINRILLLKVENILVTPKSNNLQHDTTIKDTRPLAFDCQVKYAACTAGLQVWNPSV